MPPVPVLKRVDIHLPNGRVLTFKREEVAQAGITPTGGVIVMCLKGDKITRYANFPTVFHEEMSAIEVSSSLLTGV